LFPSIQTSSKLENDVWVLFSIVKTKKRFVIDSQSNAIDL
jgi:hypothetical protein